MRRAQPDRRTTAEAERRTPARERETTQGKPVGWRRTPGARPGSRGPVPEDRQRKSCAQMEPSRSGVANACRVVVSTPATLPGPGATRPPPAEAVIYTA